MTFSAKFTHLRRGPPWRRALTRAAEYSAHPFGHHSQELIASRHPRKDKERTPNNSHAHEPLNSIPYGPECGISAPHTLVRKVGIRTMSVGLIRKYGCSPLDRTQRAHGGTPRSFRGGICSLYDLRPPVITQTSSTRSLTHLCVSQRSLP